MFISPFFHDLHSAYQAEIDDLSFDSDGKNVLQKHLREKRKELDFLLQMMELSPEMVAVVLHQGFRFVRPAVMEHVLAQDADEIPAWEQISDAVEVAPWAQPLLAQFAQAPQGSWFLSVAAALEYLYAKPARTARASDADHDEDAHANEDRDDKRQGRNDDSHTDDGDSDGDGMDDDARERAREEAGNDWLAEQGFDRKE